MATGVLAPGVLRLPDERPAAAPLELEGLDVEINADGPVDGITVNPETGAVTTELADGSVIVDLSPEPEPSSDGSDHNANLAEIVAYDELGRIASFLLEGIETDEESRKQWLEMRAKGLKLLGLEIEEPRSDSGNASVALEGMSTVRHPMLLEATLRFQANARGELLPSEGPVKVTADLVQTEATDELADALEDDLNFYLTKVATEYYPDTDRALFGVGFGGCAFKKVYYSPLRRRPTSETVDAKDLIVSDASTDLKNAGRVTQRIAMRQSVMKRMQIAGAYRDVALVTPSFNPLNPVQKKIDDIQGIRNDNQREEDRPYTVYECYCELNIRGFEDRDEDGNETGLPLPYRVVIEKDSRVILEIRRNWNEDDDTKTAAIPFVKYPFVPGLGFYDIGLVHILGNTTNALTAAWRELLDAGMFANFPGFLYAKELGRQNTNEFRVPPGGGAPIETNGMPIGNSVMALPYKDVSPTFAAFIDNIAQTGQRIGGTAEIQIAEGRQDAPVGTTLALIEQAMKPMDAVHKRLHAAQAEEFRLLKDCLRQYPESFIRAVKSVVGWDEPSFIAALNNVAIVPRADPNTPSHMHRLMKAMAIKQLSAASPQLYDAKAVDERILRMIGVDDPDSLFSTTPPNPMADPAVIGKAAELALRGQEFQQKVKNQAEDNSFQRADLQARLRMSEQDNAVKLAKIKSDNEIAKIQLAKETLEGHRDAMLDQMRQPVTGVLPS